MGFLDSLWNSITNIVTKIWNVVKVVLPYVLVIVAICFGFAWLTPVMLGGLVPVWFTGWWAAGILLGVSFLVNPTETAAIVAKVGTAAGQVVSSVVGAVVSAASSALGPLLPIILGVGAFLLLGRSNDKKKEGAA
jgi:hypothetical protein